MESEQENEKVFCSGEEESQEGEINVIPVTFVSSYDEYSEESSSGAIRNKHYKQTYRSAWEQMPDFKGWLRGVQGQPTRAYCTYCQKTLHAHRLSLLKHTCTLRHQKAAQVFASKKAKRNMMSEGEEQEGLMQERSEVEDSDTIIEYTELEANEMEEAEEQETEIDEEEGEEVETSTSYHMPVQQKNQAILNPTPPISTHVIDQCKGTSMNGLHVTLYKLINGRWTHISEGVTNTNGRFSKFLDRSDFTPGRYKLHYDVDRYFDAKKVESMYPFIEIVFDTVSSESYHIPVIVSPYGYSTYRGS